MRVIGIIALLIGLIGLVGSCNMDTSVPSTEAGPRVHNVGLMNEKQNLLIVFSLITVVGAIFTALGAKSDSSPQASPQTRPCSQCAEDIRLEAKVCRFCGVVLRKEQPAAMFQELEKAVQEGG